MDDDAPQIAAADLRQRQTGASDGRREHAVSVDRELIALPKAQKLCTTNMFPPLLSCWISLASLFGSDVTEMGVHCSLQVASFSLGSGSLMSGCSGLM